MVADWIPVKVRLPKQDGEYYVTRDVFGNRIVSVEPFATNLHKVDKWDFGKDKRRPGFYRYDSEFGHYELDNIIAWCIPAEPYMGE